MCLLCRKRKSKKRQWFLVDEDAKEMTMQVPQQDRQVVEHDDVLEQDVVEHDVVEQVVVEQDVVEQDVVEVQTTPKKGVRRAIYKKLTHTKIM
jgi:hypothetical protein